MTDEHEIDLESIVSELENAYWLTVHNKAEDYVRRLTFANYQFIVAAYLSSGKMPPNNYKKIHNHFYEYECKRKNK